MERKESSQAPQSKVRARGEIGRMTLDIEPEVLKQVIASGQLLELAATMANQAAAQISAQLVDRVAEMAVTGGSGVGVQVSYIFDGGDFLTEPPRPKFGVGPIHRFESLLQRFAAPNAEFGGGS
jgi:hypothetical protein